MKRIVVSVVAGLIVLSAGWFFVSPLFIDEVIDEPLTNGSTMPTRAAVMSMPSEKRAQLRDQLMGAVADRITSVNEPMQKTGPVRIATGTFIDADAIHRGSGEAAIYQLSDSHVVRLEDLRVTNGPALVVLLAQHPDPRTADDVKEGYIKLGKLKGNIGNQNYAVPPEIDVRQFQSVVIWCELFDVLFSPAALKAI